MLSPLSELLDTLVTRGVLGAGTAHRVVLAGQLASTLPRAGSELPETLSGEALGKLLGLSRAAVHKHVEHLRSLGFAVEPVAGIGYRLARPFADLVAAEAVLPFVLGPLDARRSWNAGLPYRYVTTCASTNQLLRQVAASSTPGMTVVTDEQTGGRGRLGRTWVSDRGKDLTFSVLLRPSIAPARAHLLSLAGALAVAEVLEAVPGLEGRVGIKWPNDVLLGHKKVCGILLEGSMDVDCIEWAVAGIGLNVNSDPGTLIEDLTSVAEGQWRDRPEPTSLREVLGADVARAPLLAALLARLTERWSSTADATLLEGLRQRDILAGRRVAVLSGPPRNEPVVVGHVLGIGPEGQLLVRNSLGDTVPVFAGDVTVRDADGGAGYPLT
jgi:BirA family transcriptional regulator, biotin operon repressor / biotin---[acetyl-CoA-carboxylase] ligase